ncbi:MAG: hypothetical protein B7Y90_16105 [Alphaproteobacteria bacterium 32-64-14]|nr:MAG: hypothetical protein B7Y90_16105 [Alphaproteobacteria bacterium 32-64-14]
MLRRLFAVMAVGASMAAPALAEVKVKAPDAIVIQIKGEVALDRDAAWARLLEIGLWWNGGHTYSGDAANVKLDAMAGGCWCELWAGGEVEHGRVVMVMPMSVLRVSTALGPLQGLGVSGALTLTLSDGAAGKTAITLDYKVSGASASGLDKIAAVIDQVLSEQVVGFTKLD